MAGQVKGRRGAGRGGGRRGGGGATAEPASGVAPRRYDSPLRRQQAAATRRRVLDAAEALFVEQGYARTSVRQIAVAAGVAVDTVYATFGTKPRLLTAIIDRHLAPDGEASVLSTAAVRTVREAPDQRTMLARFATSIAAISTAVRPVAHVLRTAAAADPDLAAVHAEMEAHRLSNMTSVAEWLAALGPLRLPVERAGEVIWAVASPDMGRLLCDERGWSEQRHAAWIEDTLVRTLLGDP